MSRVKIEGKVFEFKKLDGFLLVEETSKSGFRWVKFPSELLGWVSDSLSMCSELNECIFQKKVGFVTWSIESGWNYWGWFLELRVAFKGSGFSIFIPSSSPLSPWKLFIDSFLQAAGINSVGVDQVASLAVDSQSVVHHSSHLDKDVFNPVASPNLAVDLGLGFLKEEVDALLMLECNRFFSPTCFSNGIGSHGSCESGCFGNVEEVVNGGESSFCEFVASGFLGGDVSMSESHEEPIKELRHCFPDGTIAPDAVIEELSQEAEEIRSNSHGGAIISIVDECSGLSFMNQYFLFGKKKKQRSIAVVSFPREPFLKNGIGLNPSVQSDGISSSMSFVPNPKPSMTMRSRPRSRVSFGDSPWDRLPQGVKYHPISKYNEFERLDPDRDWILEALDLPVNASEEDVIKRMFEFQRLGKIDISRKVIRILEGISKEGRQKVI